MGKEDLEKVRLKVGTIVKFQWEVLRRIGEGGCGLVFQVINMKKPGHFAAMKIEPIGMISDDQILKMEVHVLKKLNKSKHACKLYAAGKGTNYYFLVMTLLAKSLCELRKHCPNQRFTLSTSIRLCMQCLEGIEDLHNIGFIHRDVKPSNFAMGRKPTTMRTVFMLDFGLARQYCEFDKKGEAKLREPRKMVPFRGTIRYCSVNVHRRDEQGRHDDLWSLLYMTVEMILGTLPWSNMNRARAELCKQSSEKTLVSSLPIEFHLFLKHLKKLNYNHKPDYKMLQNLLLQVLVKDEHTLADPFDWEANGEHASKFTRNAVKCKRRKASDEKIEFEKNDKDDMNTRMGIQTIVDEINLTVMFEDDDEGPASQVSGVSRSDDTLKKLEELG
ncbi:unnamed protein product [Thelazia callipaeda]|uniref:Protein kinase domain-containing protein n=1 Tax=Thelazia callipaeda TaxID=103827 RepID=A0A158RAR6_THECL|nr:unnamed protein product [Thelazia callipaeda]